MLPGGHRESMHQIAFIREKVFVEPVNEIKGADNSGADDQDHIESDHQAQVNIRDPVDDVKAHKKSSHDARSQQGKVQRQKKPCRGFHVKTD